MTEVVRSVASLQSQVDKWHRANLRVALVPTMGYLHDAHIALVKAGNKVCARTVVSIFVNPKQFGPKEDFSKYPRDETRDLDILKNLVDSKIPKIRIKLKFVGPNTDKRIKVKIITGIAIKVSIDLLKI